MQCGDEMEWGKGARTEWEVNESSDAMGSKRKLGRNEKLGRLSRAYACHLIGMECWKRGVAVFPSRLRQPQRARRMGLGGFECHVVHLAPSLSLVQW
jgi:hypothetical protein